MLLTLLLLWGCSSPKPVEETQPETVRIPNGWYLSLNNSNVDLVKASEEKPSYILSFDRSNDLEESQYYLRIAEAIFSRNPADHEKYRQ